MKAFDQFVKKMDGLLQKGKSKGYSDPNDYKEKPGGGTLSFLLQHFGDGHHPLGEIVLKAVRYSAQRDPDDLLKIAVWAYLLWSRTEAVDPDYPMDAVVTCPACGHTGPPGYVHRCPGAPAPAGRVGVSEPRQTFYHNQRDLEAPTEMWALRDIRKILTEAEAEALNQLGSRPGVFRAREDRLAALVCEESGEAVKEALNYTREPGMTYMPEWETAIRAVSRKNLRKEWVQTAAMATIALVVLDRREKK